MTFYCKGDTLDKEFFGVEYLEKKFEIGMLMDFYRNLLTNKQISVMNLYFDEDVTLAEIATQLGVSRQAVHDLIARSEKQLYHYEEKLKLFEQFKLMTKSLNDIKMNVESLKCDDQKKKDAICKDIQELIRKWEE